MRVRWVGAVAKRIDDPKRQPVQLVERALGAHDLGHGRRKAHVWQVRRGIARDLSQLVGLAGRSCSELQQDRGPDIARALAKGLVVDEDLLTFCTGLGR